MGSKEHISASSTRRHIHYFTVPQSVHQSSTLISGRKCYQVFPDCSSQLHPSVSPEKRTHQYTTVSSLNNFNPKEESSSKGC